MHLHAAFIPPVEVRQELSALVAGLEPPSPDATEARRGLFGRRTPAPEPVPTSPQLDVLELDRLVLPITDFGYLASGDARRLVDALTKVCGALPVRPTVAVSGGEALVDPDDRSVWATLTGSDDDLAAMRDIASAVVSGVQPLGFFCDRRQFRGRLPLATITASTSLEHLERVLEALAAYRSAPWTVEELTVVQRGSGVWRTVPVGPEGPTESVSG